MFSVRVVLPIFFQNRTAVLSKFFFFFCILQFVEEISIICTIYIISPVSGRNYYPKTTILGETNISNPYEESIKILYVEISKSRNFVSLYSNAFLKHTS